MPKEDQVTYEDRTNEFLNRIKLATRKSVRVGIVGNNESFFAMLLAVHEFGTTRAGKKHNVTIPARSPVRKTINDRKKMKDALAKANQVFNPEKPVREVLNAIGLTVASAVRSKIRTNLPPRLKTATIAARIRRGTGSTVALIDNGAMINRIQHEVT